MFSGRSAASHEHNALFHVLCALQAAGEPYWDLTGSNPTAAGLNFDDTAVQQALAGASSALYEPLPFGAIAARGAVSEWYQAQGAPVPTGRIVLTASTSESYNFLFNLLCDAGDEVLVPTPSYPLFEYLARFANVQLCPYRLQYDGAWHLDLDSVKAAVNERTRAIIVVNPNNPTGSFLSQAEWGNLAVLGLPLISDEVFAQYSLLDAGAPRSVLSALPAPVQPVFALSGLSKFAGLPQLKLGTIAFNCPAGLQAEVTHRLELIADTFLSVSFPVQAALPALLALAPARNALILARLKANLVLLQQAFAGSSASVLRTEGGWSAVLRLPQVMSEQAWVLHLLQQHKVLVQPGWFYDFETEPFIVLALLSPPEMFSPAVAALRDAVAAACSR